MPVSLTDMIAEMLDRPDPDCFGIDPRDFVVRFDTFCGCPKPARFHFRAVEHAKTQTYIEHDIAKHGDPHSRLARLRMVREMVVAAFGDAPVHPHLDDLRYDAGYQ